MYTFCYKNIGSKITSAGQEKSDLATNLCRLTWVFARSNVILMILYSILRL